MARSMSQAGLEKLTEPWEEFVAFPYDDKVPPRIIDGKRQYVEWAGGPIRGTITQGFGHTNAAGAPVIEIGKHWTEDYARQVLLADMAPCERHVNAALQVDVTQHQADTLYDLDFNCPSAIPHVCSLVNAGDWPAAERVMLQYVNSKGERMVGLVHRRNAEIAWANTPDDATTDLPTAAASDSADVFSPKAERAPPPKTMRQSGTGTGAMTIGAGGIMAAIKSANQAAEPLEEAKGHLSNLGILDQLTALAHSSYAGVAFGIVIAAIAAFIWWDRRSKLLNDHV